MRYGLNQLGIGVDDAGQHMLCITGRHNAQNFHLGIMTLNVFFQLAGNLDYVVNRVSVREAIGFGQHAAVFVYEDGFCGGRAAINAEEGLYSAGQWRWRPYWDTILL